jgi:hypothetical protein
MGKRNKRAITATLPPRKSGAIQAEAPAPRLPVLPDQPGGMGRWRLAVALVLGVVAPLAVVLAVGWAGREDRPQKKEVGKSRPELPSAEERNPWAMLLKNAPPRRKPVLPVWEPTSAEDRVIDAFVRLRKTNPAAARKLLGRKEAPEMKDRVWAPEEVAVLTGELFLRADELRIIAIWGGEPATEADDTGLNPQVPRAGRYTLITRGGATTPPYRLTTAKPDTSPIQGVMLNPDLIVDVRDGKVFAVRASSHVGAVIE